MEVINKLSKRLERISCYIPEKSRLADIGSDHAYLPISQVKSGRVVFAIAGEVAIAPFRKACAQVQRSELEEQISVRLADGLNAVSAEDDIDTIVIAGMGGALIAKILNNGLKTGRLTGNERLILQPNVCASKLRFWLMNHNLEIIAEEILEEQLKIYEIMVVQKGESDYSKKELFFGPFLFKEKNDLFKKKWRQELARNRQILLSLRKATNIDISKIEALKEKESWIIEALS